MLERLRSELRKTLERYCTEPEHREAMQRALARPGFALHPGSRCRAGMLALESCAAVSGSKGEAAVQAALAVELYMEAAFMFDNVADQDSDQDGGLSPAEELALGLTLMSCGAATACEAVRLSARRDSNLGALLRFHTNCVNASAGQFLDACLEKSDCVAIDKALKMTLLKSGSLGRLAAGFGASLGTDDPKLISLCEDFGFSLLAYLQLVDDLRDACPATDRKADLLRGKKTVPAVVFRNSLLPDMRPEGECGIMQPPEGSGVGTGLRRSFDASGAWASGAVLAEIFLNRARNALADLEVRLERRLGALEHLVASIEFNPQELLAVA